MFMVRYVEYLFKNGEYMLSVVVKLCKIDFAYFVL